MRHAAKAGLAFGCIALGMIGLYFNVDYSGWVLLIGALGAFGQL